jgi:heat shock protein HslJ
VRSIHTRVLSLVVLGVSLSACLERSSTGPEQWRPKDIVLGVGNAAAPLVGTTWALRELTDLSLGAARDSVRPLRVTRTLAGTLMLSASLGCNAIGASVDTVGTRLRVHSVFSTRIYCGELASLEVGYSTVLQEVAYFGVRGDSLWLYDAGFRIRARYEAVR